MIMFNIGMDEEREFDSNGAEDDCEHGVTVCEVDIYLVGATRWKCIGRIGWGRGQIHVVIMCSWLVSS